MVSNFLSRFSTGLRIFGGLVVLSMVAGLGACGTASSPVAKEQVNLRLRMTASDSVNPNEWGAASPILVQVYELKSATAFETADYFTLQSDDRKAIANDALVVDEFILRPGEVRDVVRKSASATTAIGVLAGYRDLGKSVWRAVYRLPVAPDASWYRAVIPDKTQQLHVRFDRNVVSISKSE